MSNGHRGERQTLLTFSSIEVARRFSIPGLIYLDSGAWQTKQAPLAQLRGEKRRTQGIKGLAHLTDGQAEIGTHADSVLAPSPVHLHRCTPGIAHPLNRSVSGPPIWWPLC